MGAADGDTLSAVFEGFAILLTSECSEKKKEKKKGKREIIAKEYCLEKPLYSELAVGW